MNQIQKVKHFIKENIFVLILRMQSPTSFSYTYAGSVKTLFPYVPRKKTHCSFQSLAVLQSIQNKVYGNDVFLKLVYIELMIQFLVILKCYDDSQNMKWDFPDGSVVKNLPASAGETEDVGSIPGLGRSPGGGNSKPLQYSCLRKSHGQRSLAIYSPWGRKESDITEHAHQK